MVFIITTPNISCIKISNFIFPASYTSEIQLFQTCGKIRQKTVRQNLRPVLGYLWKTTGGGAQSGRGLMFLSSVSFWSNEEKGIQIFTFKRLLGPSWARICYYSHFANNTKTDGFLTVKLYCFTRSQHSGTKHATDQIECHTCNLWLIISGSGSRDPGIVLIPNPGSAGLRDFGIPIFSHTEIIA